MIVKVKNPFRLWGKIGLRFDNYSWIKMCEVAGVEFDQMDKLEEVQLIIAWMYGAYLSCCAAEYKRPKYGPAYISKVYRWYYVNDHKTLEGIKTAMVKSKLLGKSVEDWAKEGQKKK